MVKGSLLERLFRLGTMTVIPISIGSGITGNKNWDSAKTLPSDVLPDV